ATLTTRKGAPGWARAVISSESAPTDTIAFCSPGTVPRVQVDAARASSPTVTVAGEKLPAPPTGVKLTSAPTTGLPYWSRTSATISSSSGWPTTPVWPEPVTTRVAGTSGVAVTVKISLASPAVTLTWKVVATVPTERSAVAVPFASVVVAKVTSSFATNVASVVPGTIAKVTGVSGITLVCSSWISTSRVWVLPTTRDAPSPATLTTRKGAPGWARAVISSESAPTDTIAFCSPGTVPRVQVDAARASSPTVTVAGEKLPAPPTGVKLTSAPTTGLPYWSRTSAT